MASSPKAAPATGANATPAAAAEGFKGRDDFRREKQLQEARMAGTADAEVDVNTGKMINPHNPQFITKAPWYLEQNQGPSLAHQHAWNLKQHDSKDTYTRGTKGDLKTKFVKGACENCGSTTHTRKDCFERPRKKGAKWTGRNLASDDYVEDLDMDYDAKHDRWRGYDPSECMEVIKNADEVEEARKKKAEAEVSKRLAEKKATRQRRREAIERKRAAKKAKLAEGGDDNAAESDIDSAGDTDSESEGEDEALDEEGVKVKDFDVHGAVTDAKDTRTRTTSRNLRIREDTAKYLLNLDPNSAYYDPKSRSMREDPFAKGAAGDALYAGDNFVRETGQAGEMIQQRAFAWEAYKEGINVHDVANPTLAAHMFKEYKSRSKDVHSEEKKKVLEKYGGEEHLHIPDNVLNAERETYVEYDPVDGTVVKGTERALRKSKYLEDEHELNHSSVWGSWFDIAKGKWGYKCCKQTLRNAYCTALPSEASKT
ncbi:mRNA splicing protein [Perkinsus olseni]|uniref:Pre-mRNA-splicing factor SLU7 n=1 Tax=Perkinsus olseni TaxID=32597 RepID=A0A7J6QU04_PEROL|nr:mRNA splicing protein [Perkinsus olseni]